MQCNLIPHNWCKTKDDSQMSFLCVQTCSGLKMRVSDFPHYHCSLHQHTCKLKKLFIYTIPAWFCIKLKSRSLPPSNSFAVRELLPESEHRWLSDFSKGCPSKTLFLYIARWNACEGGAGVIPVGIKENGRSFVPRDVSRVWQFILLQGCI